MTYIKYLGAIIATVFLAWVVAVPQIAGAQTGESDTVNQITGLNQVQGEIKLGHRELRETVAAIINVALSLLGVIAVVVVIIGGFFWMTAGGNEEQVTKAKGYIFSGIIGLAIILSAFAITKFVIQQLGQQTGLGGVSPTQ